MDQNLVDIYNDAKGQKFVGAYMVARPVIVVRDMELAKNMLIKDFNSFRDRGFKLNLKLNPLAG